MRKKSIFVWAAMALGALGFVAAWIGASNSQDVATARAFILSTPDLAKKYPKLSNPRLVTFRLQMGSGGKSYCTFLVNTATGYRFVSIVVDKSTDPWVASEMPKT